MKLVLRLNHVLLQKQKEAENPEAFRKPDVEEKRSADAQLSCWRPRVMILHFLFVETGRPGRPNRCVFMEELQESLGQTWLDLDNLEQVCAFRLYVSDRTQIWMS